MIATNGTRFILQPWSASKLANVSFCFVLILSLFPLSCIECHGRYCMHLKSSFGKAECLSAKLVPSSSSRFKNESHSNSYVQLVFSQNSACRNANKSSRSEAFDPHKKSEQSQNCSAFCQKSSTSNTLCHVLLVQAFHSLCRRPYSCLCAQSSFGVCDSTQRSMLE